LIRECLKVVEFQRRRSTHAPRFALKIVHIKFLCLFASPEKKEILSGLNKGTFMASSIV
jgi:hypothetical protein